LACTIANSRQHFNNLFDVPVGYESQ